MHLRVQLPARNEERTLEAVLRRTLAVLDVLEREGRETSVLVLDDASSDDTGSIARRVSQSEPRVHVLSIEKSAGLGSAFRRGVARALEDGVDVLVNIDADGQFDPADVLAVARPVLAGSSDVVTASRFLGIQPSPPIPAVRAFGNHALARIVSLLAGRRISDACCGLRAFSRRALSTMKLREDFTYTQETLLQCAWAGLSLDEVPVLVRGVRAVGRSRVAGSVVKYGVRVAAILGRAWLRKHAAEPHEAVALLQDRRSP